MDLPLNYWFPRSLRRFTLTLVVLGMSVAIAMPPDFELINPYGMPQFLEFLRAAVSPDLSPDFLQVSWDAVWVTFSYALIGTGLSLCLGFLGACVTADVVFRALFPRLANIQLHRTLKLLLTIPRSLHEVIWGLLLINLVGLDPIAGILAIAIPYGSIVAKIYAEILDDTPREALDSLLNAGSRPVAAIAFGLFPRAKLSLMSYGFYRFECSLRSAAILGVIGAGGLGYQMMLSLESVRYAQLWTLFYAIVILNGSVDLLSAYVRHRIGAPKRFELKRSLRVARHATGWSQYSGLLTGLIVLGLGIVAMFGAWKNLNPDFSKLLSFHAWSQLMASQQLAGISVDVEILGRLPWLSLQTLAMSILAIAIAGIGAFGLSWLAAMSLGRLEVKLELTILERLRIFIAHSILLMMRAIPSPIWALVFLYLFRPGIMVGAIALGVHNIGVMGRLFAEDIENAEVGPWQNLQTAGGPTLLTLSYGLIPRLFRRFINYAAYRWEVCLRESLILALVGAGGLGVLLKEEISNFNVPQIIILLTMFGLFTLGMEWIIQNVKAT